MPQLLELVESPIRITSAGQWLHGDEPLHPRVTQLFQQHIEVRGQGDYWIRLGFNTHQLVVDDTAFFVSSVHVEPDGIRLCISDGATEMLAPATLMQSDEHVLYCMIERGAAKVPCRFVPAAYKALSPYVEEDALGCYIAVGQQKIRPRPYTLVRTSA